MCAIIQAVNELEEKEEEKEKQLPSWNRRGVASPSPPPSPPIHSQRV